jgi:hypothetical protein
MKREKKKKKEGLMWTLLISKIGLAGLLFILRHRMEMLKYVRHLSMLVPISTLEIPNK